MHSDIKMSQLNRVVELNNIGVELGIEVGAIRVIIIEDFLSYKLVRGDMFLSKHV